MSQTYTLTFPTVTTQVFLKLKHEISKTAKVQTEPDGTVDISGAGIEAEARYDSARQLLTVDLIDKPVFLTVDLIRQQIQSALLRCKTTA
jgi:hypothetical protein